MELLKKSIDNKQDITYLDDFIDDFLYKKWSICIDNNEEMNESIKQKLKGTKISDDPIKEAKKDEIKRVIYENMKEIIREKVFQDIKTVIKKKLLKKT